MLSETKGRWALAISLFLHAGIAAAHLRDRSRASPRTVPPTDPWAGRTFEVDAVLSKPAAPKANAPARARPEELSAAKNVKTPPAAAAQPALAEPEAFEKPMQRAPSARPAVLQKPPRALPSAASDEHESNAQPEPEPPAAAAAEYGAEGLAPGVRRLAKAFTRAIPAAISRDPLWARLPLGSTGTLRVAIVIDADGRIASAEPLDREPPPNHLQHLLERTVALLKAGRFALSQSQSNAGTEVLRIEARISEREPSEGFEPDHVLYMRNEEPQAGRPGKASFTLASGKHIEIKITIERPRE